MNKKTKLSSPQGADTDTVDKQIKKKNVQKKLYREISPF